LISVYRLCREEHSPKSGIGAKKYGGRWNPIGFEVIYAAATASLAALEVLAHNEFLPTGYTVTEIQIPDSTQIETVSDDDLPPGWDAPDYSREAQQFGGLWIREGRTVGLSVPSTIVRTERNFLLNPDHSNFGLLKFLAPQPFIFNQRLKPKP